MKVVLLENIKHLGQKNEIKDVSIGYARNFLIKRGLAKPADKSAINEVEEINKTSSEQKEVVKGALKTLQDETKENPIKISVKAGKRGEVFGSVKDVDILNTIYKKFPKIKAEKIKVDMNKPLKELGVHEIQLMSGGKTLSTVKIEIFPEA